MQDFQSNFTKGDRISEQIVFEEKVLPKPIKYNFRIVFVHNTKNSYSLQNPHARDSSIRRQAITFLLTFTKIPNTPFTLFSPLFSQYGLFSLQKVVAIRSATKTRTVFISYMSH